jgi:hypothetical protein
MRADLVALRPAEPAAGRAAAAAAAMAASTRVDVVVIAGEVRVSGGRAQIADADAIDARAREARERLW